MPNRFAVIVVIAALASATTISVTGQEEPLPRVTPRGAASAPATAETPLPASQTASWQNDLLVVLPSDPIRPARTYTIADAARDNDYATFHALYLEAKQQGRDVSAWTSLDDVWTFAVTDPVGGFYGTTMFQRLSRAYPGFESYIETYRIIDARGRTFYPTSETRAFLLTQALRGTSPAASTSIARQKSTSTAERRSSATRRDRTPTAPRTADRSTKPATTHSAAPAKQPVSTPAATVPATVPAAAPAPVPAAVAPTVSEPTSSGVTPAETQPAAAPQPIAPATPAPTAQAEQPSTAAPGQEAQPSATGRGLLLLVIGLAGVGILALMLRTPREEMPTSIIDHSSEATANGKNSTEKPHATVEPIRKRTAKPGNSPRQTGTHS